jgi:hypothetical protein
VKTKTGFIVLVVVFSCAAAVAHDGKAYIFDGTPDEVFNAAVKVIQADWAVSYADRQTMTLSFTTGTSATTWGMDCSAVLEQVSPGQIKMTIKAQKKHQLYAFGVGDRIASKLFKGMEAELASHRVTATQDK